MYTRNENSLKLVEIQESVLPEDEWLIGISNLNYFNGIGYSMPMNLESEKTGSMNLYALIPGIFYCSGQQTSVDAVLIEVTQKELFGMTLSSFRPEDVRPLDIATGMILDESGYGKTVRLSIETLGSFHSESFLKDAGLSDNTFRYSREIELAMRLSSWMPTKVLKQAYASSSFLRTRIIRLLEDIEFFGLTPRRRIYVRNQKHPFGTVVEVRYRMYDDIVTLGSERGITCPDDIDLENELSNLTFSKGIGSQSETDIESAIMDILQNIDSELEGRIERDIVLQKFTGEMRI